MLTAQYRRELAAGSLVLEGSVTRDDTQPADAEFAGKTRGHVNLLGDFALGRRWRYGFTVERATDATYLRRYRLGGVSLLAESAVQAEGLGGSRGNNFLDFARGKPYLTENLFVHGRERNWRFTVDSWRFQSLNPWADKDRSPAVAPIADFDYRSDPGARGDMWTLRANARLLTRRSGADSARLSTTGRAGGCRCRRGSATASPSPRRFAWTAIASRTRKGPRGGSATPWSGRALPQAALEWRWPWVRPAGAWRLAVEPLATAVVAPDVADLGDADPIRNDDSLAFEFDETNLFDDNRYPGLDRVEGGTRGAVGLRLGAFGTGNARAELLFGQAFRPWGNARSTPIPDSRRNLPTMWAASSSARRGGWTLPRASASTVIGYRSVAARSRRPPALRGCGGA